MIIYYRESHAQWRKEYYVVNWCCDELKEMTEDYDIEVDNQMIQFSTCEDEGVRYLPFRFKYCPCCGKEMKIRKGEPRKTAV